MPRTTATRVADGPSRSTRLAARFVRRFWGALLVGVVALALVITSVLMPGLKVNDVHLHEDAVYVVKTDGSLVGNLNLQSDEMANAALVGAADYQVLQLGRSVVVKSTNPNQLASYDPATNQMGSPVNLPPNATVTMSNGVVAVTNPDNGRVWFGSIDAMLRTDFQLAKANMDVGEAGVSTVTASGSVIGLSVAKSALVRGEQQVPLPFGLDPNANVALSAVGERAVVLDRTSQRIWLEGTDKVWEVDAGSTAQLAPPSATAADGVGDAQAIYATRAGLIALTKDGPRSLSGLVNQNPVAPLIVDDCVHGVFGTQYVTRCADDEQATITAIPEASTQSQLRITSNRGSVVINDAVSGWIWLVDKNLKLIKDWSRVTPSPEEKDEESEETQQVVNPERDQPNTAPVAKDDLSLAARTGRSTVLPVLDNDSDADGDILTILGPPQVKGATLDLIRGGTGLQITLPEGAKDVIDFSYSISDGRGKTATARARVKPLSPDQAVVNELPKHFRPKEKLVLSPTQRATKRVLLDWRDPDGDDLILLDAKPEGDGQVTFTSDGQVTFQDVGKTTGPKIVKIKVSDGDPSGRVVEGELQVEVVKGTIVPPIANGDHVTTSIDRPVVVRPLDNDFGPNLTLREVAIEGGTTDAEVQPKFHEQSFTFTAAKAGTYYVGYKVTNGPLAFGLVRIDVTSGAKENNRPVAARDVVLLPPGGSVLVDPLLNDSDSDGDVLVIQSVSEDPSLRVVMEQRRVLTVTAERMPTKPITLTYWVSDGSSTTPGTIVVIPIKQVGSQAPQAAQDDVRARAGSTVSIPVLENDFSPLGLTLAIDKIVDGPQGRAWVDGDKIRVAVPAGAAAAGIALKYQVKDSDGRTDSAAINITVTSPDAQNEAPVPTTVEARVLSGTTTRVLIPLDNIDPNGDAVRLLGINTGPHLGRVTKVGEHYLSYEAFPNSQGTDSFRYEVVDSLGMVGIGEVRVGVAPPVGANTGPTTVPDEIVVRPGRQATLPLLGNDFDIDGDTFGFVSKDPIDLPLQTTILNGNAISFTAPTKPGAVAGTYYVRDSRKGESDGTITVRVDPNAPNLVPVAVDDLVMTSEVIGKDYVDVPVLKNDYDPDQASKTLTITLPSDVPAAVATVDAAKQVVRVKVSDHAQQVRYTITDGEGGNATAVATVPGTQDVVPMLKDPKYHLTVTAGERTVIDVNALVQGTNGRTVQLPSADRVSVTNGRPIVSPDKIDWTPDVEFAGQAAVVFEVRDVVPAGDKTAKRAVISVPVTVKAAPNITPEQRKKSQTLELPPELIGDPPVLQVGAGEEKRIDLAQFYKDPNGQDIRFDNWKQTNSAEGMTWKVADGRSMISATVAENVKPGSSIKLVGTVIDASNNTAAAELTITSVGSTRPEVTVVNDTELKANAGEPITVRVLANDKSNLIKDTSLHLLSAAPLGAGQAKVDGDVVVVTPPEKYVGELQVRYTVVDATRDPNRERDGLITLTVRAAPGEPSEPWKVEENDSSVVIKWTDGALNGLPLLKRIVRGSAPGGASVTQECELNTCTITGLTNDRTYTFTVTQTNEIGEATSKPSGPMVPDVKPEKMAAPEVAFDDAALKLTWKPAVSKGSPVTRYRITNLNDNSVQMTPATSFTWQGLTNGVNYQFTVEAENKKGWSVASDPSKPEHPTGPPEPATNLSAADRGDESGGWITLSFDIPMPTVDPIERFDVVRVQDNKVVLSGQSVTAGARQSVDLPSQNGQTYSFTVITHNRGTKPSVASKASNEVKAFGRPDTPVGAQISPLDRAIRLASVPGSGSGGGDVTKIVWWVVDENGARTDCPDLTAAGGTCRVPKNGPKYYAMVVLYSGTKASGEGGTASVRPFGSPRAASHKLNDASSKDGVPVSRFQLAPSFDYTDPQGNRYSNGNAEGDLKLSWSGGGQSGAPDANDQVSVSTPNGPVDIVTRVSGPGGSSEGSFNLYSPMVTSYSGRDLNVTLKRWPVRDVRCRVSGAYDELLGGDLMFNAAAGDTGQTLTLKAPPADATNGTPGTGWSISCQPWRNAAPVIEMNKSGKLP